MASRLGSRLSALRSARFVGRESELELFSNALGGAESSFVVLHVYGPGGVGKSSLLRRMAELTQGAGIPTVMVDGASLGPGPGSFEAAVRASAGLDEHSGAVATHEGKLVLILDGYERLGTLEPWLRDTYFPSLPDGVLILIASRQPPSAAMRADPAWRGLLRALPLRNLSPKESHDLLERTTIPEGQRQSVIQFTHGHPLALSLVADLYEVSPDRDFEPGAAPELVQHLVERFMDEVPDEEHRAALQACALPRVTTETLLARLLDQEGVSEPFEWLRKLSFVEQGRDGLAPHDMAREVLITDLKWRNPSLSRKMHDRARSYYAEQLAQTSGLEQQALLFDYIFLHRHNPVVQPFFDWELANSILGSVLRPEDVPAILELVERHEGKASAQQAQRWIELQPHRFIVFRAADRPEKPAGFVAMLSLGEAEARDIAADPAMNAAQHYLASRAPLRQGEDATVFRFWMADETYQGVSPVQSQIFVAIVRSSMADAAHTFLPVADADFWSPLFGYAELRRLESADFKVGDRSYAMFGHDWRSLPPMAWLELLGRKETGATPAPRSDSNPREVVVLSREEFETAVTSALKGYAVPTSLNQNALLKSKLVIERAGISATPAARITALRELILEVAQGMKTHPKTNKLYRALHVAYFHPVATQELAAEKLDVSLSSFRRHLQEGTTQLGEQLWQREIG